MLLMLAGNLLLFGQTDPPTVPLDDEMKALIDQVEGQEDATAEASTKSFEKPHQLEFATEAEKTLYSRVSEYMNACANGDWEKAYTYFWAPYRDAVDFSSYIKQDKAALVSFQVVGLQIQSEECGFVRLKYGISNSMMDLGEIPSRQRWHMEDGAWHLIADPFANMMGLRAPGMKKIEMPCDMPERPTPTSKEPQSKEE